MNDAYFAGLLDALGIMEMRMIKGKLAPYLEIRRADRELLDLLAARFGGSVCAFTSKGHPGWYWRRTFNMARAIVAEVRPHLRLRTFAADAILRWHVVPRADRWLYRKTKLTMQDFDPGIVVPRNAVSVSLLENVALK